MLFIRQNATHKVVIGPVVAVGDGFTPVTTLAVSTADEAEAILHDNGTVVDISGYTFAAITTADGYYHLTLQSGISGTVGHLTIVINDDSLCLPVKAEFTVIEEAAYDAVYAASAPGYVVDQPVNVTKVGGTTQTANDNGADINAIKVVTDALPDSGALSSLATASALATVDSNVDAILVDTGTTLEGHLTDIKGGTFSGSTDSLEAIRNRGDAAWTTATGFSTHSAADVRAEMDANSVGFAVIAADTNELQTDWADGGRLDLLVDGIKAVTDALPDSGALSSLATASALATVDGVVDDLKSGIIYGSAVTGTLSTTQATSNLTGYADDQMNGRVIIWLTGNCAGEATDITDYANTSGLLTFTALTTAPSNGDTFKIV